MREHLLQFYNYILLDQRVIYKMDNHESKDGIHVMSKILPPPKSGQEGMGG